MNNLPIKKEEGFWEKLKNFFKKLLYPNKEVNVLEINKQTKEENNIPEINVRKDNFINSIKQEINEERIKEIQLEEGREAFLDEIEKDPNILFNLSIERLKKINKYYDTSIKNYEDKIKKLQAS